MNIEREEIKFPSEAVTDEDNYRRLEVMQINRVAVALESIFKVLSNVLAELKDEKMKNKFSRKNKGEE
jgi:hypothetical protein